MFSGYHFKRTKPECYEVCHKSCLCIFSNLTFFLHFVFHFLLLPSDLLLKNAISHFVNLSPGWKRPYPSSLDYVYMRNHYDSNAYLYFLLLDFWNFFWVKRSVILICKEYWVISIIPTLAVTLVWYDLYEIRICTNVWLIWFCQNHSTSKFILIHMIIYEMYSDY